jgi:hypothetical protein
MISFGAKKQKKQQIHVIDDNLAYVKSINKTGTEQN